MQPEHTAGFRLSPQQDRVATLSEGLEYQNSVCLMECRGIVTSEVLTHALKAMVARHEILRTVFRKPRELKLPLQVILDNDTPAAEVIDLQQLPARSQQDHILAAFCDMDASMILANDPPVLRCTIFLLTRDKKVLLLSLPSLCADSASFAVLARDLQRLLRLESQPDDVLQYADITEWQHDLLQAMEAPAAAARTFWEKQTHTPLRLPFERPGTGDRTIQRFELPVQTEMLAALRKATDVYNADESDFLLTVWLMLLARVAPTEEPVVLMSSPGREYDEVKEAVGLFQRYLPVRVLMEGACHFEELLRHVTRHVKQARDQQDQFAPGSSASSADIGFEYSDLRDTSTGASRDPSVCPVMLRTYVEDLKLRLVVLAIGDGLKVTLEYRADSYPQHVVQRLATSYTALLSQATSTPGAALEAFRLVDQEARLELLAAGCGPHTQQFLVPVHRQIRHVCSRFSGDSAVRSGAFGLSYGELEGRANSLGRYLAGLGVKRGSLVGLCVSRSAQMMVAVLAILKAGAAYVPLGADQPKARLAQQLAGIEVLLTEAGLTAQLSEFTGVRVILDDPGQPWQQEAMDLFEVEVSGDDLAYVIYTSGSTGAPKGVAVRHRNLSNYAGHIVRTLELDRERLIYATVSTLTADLGNTVLYPALLTGGCLHILPYDVATDGRRMASYQLEHGIDVLKIVPSHLAALLDSGGEAVLPKRLLITGGEALKPALVERVLQGGSCEMINHYGPTETTVGSLMLRLNQYDWKHSPAATIPIGRPIANTRVYVLDANRQLVPVGIAGELYIAGAGVTAGYLGQPGKTAERFLDDPFQPPATMYRTGDLVRWLPDGVIEFLGRTDDQVKIRGFRVELGEIETILAAQPGVRHSCVLARPRPGDPDDQQIVAYTVLDRQLGTSIESLRHAIQDQLPDYMVPAAIVALPRMPLTPNGKIDRKALPEPDQRDTRHFKPPATITEELVANVWQEVLKITQLSTDENFFDLGGHSLLATQVVSRLRRVLSVDLPLRTMFDTPTVAQIARYIDASRLAGADPRPPMKPILREGPLPLSFAQQRLWILDQLEPDNHMYNVPRMMRLRGPLNVDALLASVDQIVSRHEPLRTSFSLQRGEPVQDIQSSAQVPYRYEDLTMHPEDTREPLARELVAFEARSPFRLDIAPLLRILLLKLGEHDHILTLTMHHVVSDAWSATVFMDELKAFYEGMLAGEAIALPELTLQYADYASWQRNWFQGQALEQQLTFWREQLAEAPAVLSLPADHPRPAQQTFAGAAVRFNLPLEGCNAIKALCRREGATLFMGLLATYQILLSRLSGQERIVVGTDSANRFTVESEGMIGFFINLLPLKTDLTCDPHFTDVLRQVRETTLACYAHQEMPFDKIVEELRPERSLSHNPIVQVLFVLQNTPAAATQFGGVEVSSFNLPLTRSKFDLALFASEHVDGLDCLWVYSTELFERSTILRMAEMFSTLIASIVANPERRVSALAIQSEEHKLREKDERIGRKQFSKEKLMSAALKPVSLVHEAGE